MPSCFVILFISGSELIVVLLAAWLLLGTKRLPETARMLGKGIREIRKATADLKQEFAAGEMQQVKDEFRSVQQTLTGESAPSMPASVEETPEARAARMAGEEASYQHYYEHAADPDLPEAGQDEEAHDQS